MASVAIQLNKVGITFGPGEELFSSIDLDIGRGEVFVLIGPSGAGKSVLLKTMAGVMTPTSGQVFVDGTDIHFAPLESRKAVILKMGMLFQKNALFDSMTSAENIAFPLREVTDCSEKEINRRIEHYLEAVAIPHARDLFPDEISGGMQKRLGIARALALDPEIILYDDPTAGLDPITSRLIIQLIQDLQKEKNSTVVAITNDMNRAYQMADRIGMVVDGELIITGTVEETKNHKDPRVHQFISGLLEGPLTELE